MQLIGEGKFEFGLTAPLVFEYEEVCKRLVGEIPLTIDDVDRMVDYLCQAGNHSIVYFQLRPSLPDPDDELVLEAAVASGSDWIVTHNVRDFAGSLRYGIEVLTPKDALQRIEVIR